MARTLVTLKPEAKSRLNVITALTHQSEGRVISELLTRFGSDYLRSITKDLEQASKEFTYPQVEEKWY